jgi:hypothetical protein
MLRPLGELLDFEKNKIMEQKIKTHKTFTYKSGIEKINLLHKIISLYKKMVEQVVNYIPKKSSLKCLQSNSIVKWFQ